MQDTTVRPSRTAKLLGVTFDLEIRLEEHVQHVVKKATAVNIATGGLRHLRPKQMRELYQACVTPIVDYASTVWHNPRKDNMQMRALGTIQRTVLIRILSAFKTVATQAMEVEAYVLPTHMRLKKRALNVLTSLCALPPKHPIHSVITRASQRARNVKSCRRFLSPKQSSSWTWSRWSPSRWLIHRRWPHGTGQFSRRYEYRIIRRQLWQRPQLLAAPGMVVYTDGSAGVRGLGAAAVLLGSNQTIFKSRQTSVGPASQWSIHSAELIGIYNAIRLLVRHLTNIQDLGPHQHTATILSDSKSALIPWHGDRPLFAKENSLVLTATWSRPSTVTTALSQVLIAMTMMS